MKKWIVAAAIGLSCLCHAMDAPPLKQTDELFLLEGDIDCITKPYLIPVNHPVKCVLDAIFVQNGVLENETTLAQAGFITLFSQPTSFIKVVRHPSAPGYVFKLYLESEKRMKRGKPGWVWLTNRCVGAERIKAIIKAKKIRHFCVADKWLYRVPNAQEQPLLLVARDMELAGPEENVKAWKTKVTKAHLRELYAILSEGCGSHFLTGNVPYCKNGKFAFIDTEYPKRTFTISKARKYLSDDMKRYWDKLVGR